jgi:hypothetical protein
MIKNNTKWKITVQVEEGNHRRELGESGLHSGRVATSYLSNNLSCDTNSSALAMPEHAVGRTD